MNYIGDKKKKKNFNIKLHVNSTKDAKYIKISH